MKTAEKYVNLDNFNKIVSRDDLADFHYQEDKDNPDDRDKVLELLTETAKNNTLNKIFHLARWWVEFDAPIAFTEIKANQYQNLLEFLELSLGESELNEEQKRKINTFKIPNETEYKILKQFICFYNFNNQKIKHCPDKVFHTNRVFALCSSLKPIIDYKLTNIKNGIFIYDNEHLGEFLKQKVGSNLEGQDIANLKFLLDMLIAHKSYVEDRAKEHNQFITNEISALNEGLSALKEDPTKNKGTITSLGCYITDLERYLCSAKSYTSSTLENHITFITKALNKASASSATSNLRFVFSLLLFFYCAVICNVLYLKAKAVNAAVTVFGFIGVFSLCWAVYERVRKTESEKFKGPEISEVGSQQLALSPGQKDAMRRGNEKYTSC